jgi:hypothetical protein
MEHDRDNKTNTPTGDQQMLSQELIQDRCFQQSTLARRNFVTDAVNAGYLVEPEGGSIAIHAGKTKRSTGIRLWPDGTATRNDCDPSAAMVIRTLKEMRQLLELN